jgi:hypothetical protein
MSAPSIFLVLAVGALEHVYSASANTTHVKRTVLIVDGDRARRPSPLILWNATARCELKIGDVAYASALRRAHASPRWRTHRDALVAARGCEIRAVASAEAVAGRRERRALGAEFSTKNGFDGRAAMRRTIERARKEHADVLRRAVDAAEARRRESFGREAGYVEVEALDGTSAALVHVLGRVVRETIAPSSWRPRAGGRDGARYVRRIVWVVQTHGGRCVAICLPPTTEAAAAERSLLKDGAVIDVRNALVRRNAQTGVCDLVCDVRSHWRALDGKDPRYADVCARAPKSAFEQTLTFEALALAMHSNGFARASSMIRFKACVRWVKVATERRRVPPMLRETDSSVTAAMTYLACLACSRELETDHNNVYKMCHCTSDDARCGFVWRDIVLGMQSDHGDSKTVIPVRARGDIARRLLFNVDASSVLDEHASDDEFDDFDDDDAAPRSDHKKVVLAAINALAAGRRNAAMDWRVKFPALDENGLPRRDELELVDFNAD